MENKMIIKNMEYWKKKNNIPGIEAAKESGLADGRAGSAPFQMATPGESPNKIPWGKALGGAFGSLFGLGDADKQVMGMANQAVNLAQGAGGQQMNPGNPVVQPVQVPVQQPGVLAMQAEGEGVLGGQEIAKQNENFELDEENGKLMTTEQFGGEQGILINDPDNVLEGAPYGSDDFDYMYKVEEDGSYTLTGKKEKGGDQGEGSTDPNLG